MNYFSHLLLQRLNAKTVFALFPRENVDVRCSCIYTKKLETGVEFLAIFDSDSSSGGMIIEIPDIGSCKKPVSLLDILAIHCFDKAYSRCSLAERDELIGWLVYSLNLWDTGLTVSPKWQDAIDSERKKALEKLEEMQPRALHRVTGTHMKCPLCHSRITWGRGRFRCRQNKLHTGMTKDFLALCFSGKHWQLMSTQEEGMVLSRFAKVLKNGFRSN